TPRFRPPPSISCSALQRPMSRRPSRSTKSCRVVPMMRHFAIPTVFALVATLSAQPPQEDKAKIQELKRSVDRLTEKILDERARLLLNIKVNGTPLDPKIVKREAVYLTGGKLVEAKVADFFIFEEVKKQVDEHRKNPEYFTITDDEVLREIEPM